MGGFVIAVHDVVCNIDWLALSGSLRVLGTTAFLPKGWVAQEMGRTAVWGRRVYVMNQEGIKVGTFLMDPISPIIKSDRIVLEVANVFLYHNDFHRIMDILETVYPMHIDGIQRVDVCGDFEMDMSRWQVVRELENGSAYIKGLRRGVQWWQKDGAIRKPHQLSWGGKDSIFKWKLYNKHKELWEGGQCSKPYIEEIWGERGLNPKKVWRLECSITSVNRLDIERFGNLDYREWFDRCADIFSGLYADKFVIREDYGHKDRRDDPIVTLLDIYGDKIIKHRKKKDSEVESDAERRIVCKLWKEFTDAEVRCNDFAMQGLRDHICYMFQKQSNINAVCRRFKITEGEAINLLS